MKANGTTTLFISLVAIIAAAGSAMANPGMTAQEYASELGSAGSASHLSEKEKDIARKEKELEEKIQREATPEIRGIVQETMESGGYTYVLLADGEKKTWVAMSQMKVALGQELIFYCNNEMWNFKSKSLGRTFDRIYFCNAPDRKIGGEADGMMAGKVSSGSAGAVAAPVEKIKVDKATGPGAYTVEETYTYKAALDNKKVTVKGKVVKFSSGIMKRNWIHLQDGSGDAQKKNSNLVVTTQDAAKVGDIVTISGTLKADKDFGGGYRYDVIVEEASVK